MGSAQERSREDFPWEIHKLRLKMSACLPDKFRGRHLRLKKQ